MSAELTLQETKAPREGGLSWGRLLYLSALAMAVSLLALMFLIGGVIPPLILIAALFAGAAWLYRHRERAGAILLAVLFVALLATNLPFLIPSFILPASTADFLPAVFLTVLAVVGAISAIAALRRRGDRSERAPRMVVMGAVTVMVIAAVIAAVAKLAYPDFTARSGDITLAAEDFQFTDRQLTAQEGRVAVFVENNDDTLHTFTIEELGVDVDIPAGEPARVVFDAGPGTYEFICRPHAPSMSGTLEVSG